MNDTFLDVKSRMISLLRMSSLKLEEVGRRRASYVSPPAQVFSLQRFFPAQVFSLQRFIFHFCFDMAGLFLGYRHHISLIF